MSTITTRSGKGSPLTNNEVDANFTNLNTDKLESGDLSVVTTAVGTAALAYNSGVFTYTPPDLTAIDLSLYAPLAGATFTGDVEAPEFIGSLRGNNIFRAQAGEALTKGDAVYISGISGNTPVVNLADADVAGEMPAFGVASADASLNSTVDVVTYGAISGLDTSGFALGDTLYVGTTPGQLVNTAPSGESSLIQNIGKVERVHASAGILFIAGAGRTNATPNLNDGNFFLGNSSNQAVSTDFTTAVLGEISAGTGIGLSGGVISNTAPDQTVALTGAGATSISGTYPNFTITSTDTNTVYTHPSSHPISFITGLQAALDGKVDDSQVLTNVPAGALFTDTVYTLPFADNSANWNTAYSWGNHASQSYATQSYVGTAISNLVDSSPAALDTLNELAAALGDDPNFATTVTNSIATKLPLTGGTLTGPVAMNDTLSFNTDYNEWMFQRGNMKLRSDGNYAYFSGVTGFYMAGFTRLHAANLAADFGTVEINGTTVIDSSRNLTNIGTLNGGTAWRSNNDGSGSGLDADLLDGQQGTYYYPASNPNGYTSNVGDITGVTAGTGLTGGGTSGTPTLNVIGGDGITANADNITVDSTVFRNNSAQSLQFNTTTGEALTFKNSTSGGLIQVGFQQNDTDGMHHRAYLKAWKGSTTASGNVDLIVRGSSGSTTSDVLSLRSGNASPTWRGQTIWNAGNDGSGSGLDADTVDGIQGSSFLRSDVDDTMAGDLLMDSANAEINLKAGAAGTSGAVNWTFNTTGTNYAALKLPYDTRATTGFHIDSAYPISIDATTRINFDIGATNYGSLDSGGFNLTTGDYATTANETRFNTPSGYIALGPMNTSYGHIYTDRPSFYFNKQIRVLGSEVWHTGNGGSGSGLDADLLDGQQGSYYAANSSLNSYMPIRMTTPFAVIPTGGWAGYNLGNGTMLQASSTGLPSGGTHGYWHVTGRRDTSGGYVGLYFQDYSASSGMWIGKSLTSADPTWERVWSAGTGGSGSGLDADLLDGQEGSYYAPASHVHSYLPLTGGTLTGNVSATRFRSTNGTIAPLSSSYTFSNVFTSEDSSTRVAYFDGNGGNASVWWGNGANAHAALDSSDGLLNVWVNPSNGSWYNIADFSTSGLAITTGGLRVNGIAQSVVAQHDASSGWSAQIVSKNATTNVASFLGSWNGYAGVFAHTAALNAWAPIYINAHSGSGQANVYTGPLYVNGSNLAWHAGNGGSGSGLDADLLDGQQGSYYYPASNPNGYQTTSGSVAQSNRVSGSAFATTGSPDSVLEYQQASGQSDTRLAPSTDWHNSIRMGHGNPYNYYSNTIAIRMTGGGSGTMFTQHISGNTPQGWRTQWDSSNGGSGSGLDADLLDGYQSAEQGGNTIHRLASNGYSQLQNWTNVAGQGIFSTTTNNAHFYPNAVESYGTWRIDGTRNGYTGIYLQNGGGVVMGMYDAGGNGGEWAAAAGGGWHHYYHRGNRCMGVAGSSTSGSYGLYEQGGGIYSTGNITAYSDRRVKENIRTIDNALETVEQMRGVYYNRIDDEEKKTVIGFIAQEVDEVEGAKPLVTYAEDVDQYGVSYGNTAALLVEAIKDLSQQVKDLQSEIKEMKNA